MEDDGDVDIYEEGEVLAAMQYNVEAYQSMVKSTLKKFEYIKQLNI